MFGKEENIRRESIHIGVLANVSELKDNNTYTTGEEVTPDIISVDGKEIVVTSVRKIVFESVLSCDGFAIGRDVFNPYTYNICDLGSTFLTGKAKFATPLNNSLIISQSATCDKLLSYLGVSEEVTSAGLRRVKQILLSETPTLTLEQIYKLSENGIINADEVSEINQQARNTYRFINSNLPKADVVQPIEKAYAKYLSLK